MELINKIEDKGKLSCIKTKIIITICILIILCTHSAYGWSMASGYRVTSFLISICLSVIIYLWIYFAPKLKEEIIELECCFDELGYKYAYNQYKLNLAFNKCTHDRCLICKENCKGKYDEVGKECKFPFHIFVKTIYKFCWFIITVYLGWALYKCDLIALYIGAGNDNSLYWVGIINLFLYIATMVLNGNGFYYCFANIYFLRTIGRKKTLEKWKYNKFLPATTNGLRQIFTYSKRCILIYLLVSSLFSLAYTIMIASHPDIRAIDSRHMFCMTFLIILIGAGTSITLFVSSHIFIQRILNRWKRQSHMEFQCTLNSLDDSDLGEIKTIIHLLREIDNDRVNYDFKVILSVILSIVTIVLNILNIIRVYELLN